MFGMAGMLSYPSVTPASLGATFCLGLALATATTLGALMPAARLWRLATELLPPVPAGAPRGLTPACRAASLPLLGRVLVVVPLWGYPVLHGGVGTLVGMALGHDHDQVRGLGGGCAFGGEEGGGRREEGGGTVRQCARRESTVA